MVHLKSVLAANLKAQRKSQNLTQESLAEKAGTAPTYIAMIESELRSPSFKMIECIAEALGIEPPELFSTRNYPAESAAELIEDLSDKFDRFLRASIREIRNGSKQE